MTDTDDTFQVRGKRAIITGGSRGVGRGLVLGLARAGVDVVVASRDQKSCESVAARAREFNVRAEAISCHVGRWDALPEFVAKCWDALGGIDILVNNAGIAPVAPRMVDFTEELVDKTLAVNLKGPFRLSTLVGQRMVDEGIPGSIINISSGSAEQPGPKTAAYAAAKAGLNALTMALAIEYGPSVRVNTIGLGPVRSDATASWIDSETFLASARDGMAIGRPADPSEIVGTVLYLAGPAASFTTGAVLRVDGGIHGAVGAYARDTRNQAHTRVS